MTDAEIIKALKCLAGEQTLCRNCTYKNTNPYPFCREICAKDALDLINRQKADNELLKENNSLLTEAGQEWQKRYETAKAEAIKEFAERLKYRTCCIPQHHFTYAEVEQHIDYLVKEMAGDTE